MLRRNVLILHSGALGDFVLAWPLILALSRLHPQSRIIVVTQHSKGALAEAALRVESADVDSGWHAIFADGSEPPENVIRLLNGAHAICSFVCGAEDVAARRLREIGGEAQVVTLAPRPAADFSRHASEFLLDQLAPFPALAAGARQIVHSIETRGISVARSDGGDVVLHPGSGSLAKCWPVEKFIKLADKLKRKRRSVRILIGEVETERLTESQIAALKNAGDVRRPQTYVDLLNELRTASAVVGNDSGPAHLAGVIGAATVALFGPTDPAVWRPLGPRVRVLRHQPIESLSVDDVLHAVMDAIGG